MPAAVDIAPATPAIRMTLQSGKAAAHELHDPPLARRDLKAVVPDLPLVDLRAAQNVVAE